MKNLFVLLIMFFCGQPLIVTAQIVLQGKIEYTRKLNIHRQYDGWDEDGDNEYVQTWLAKLPKYDTRNFSYFFNNKQSKYAPIKQEESPLFSMMGSLPGTETQVFTDFENHKNIASKKVFEEIFLIQDSLRKSNWKIMDEVRTIAGYGCRKAITKINDSVVVVAFYTDRIPVSGGPEMFGGLPGMILEIAVPRLYTTWVAKSIVIEAPTATDLTAPNKGKKSTMLEMQKTIKSGTKNWGKFADKNIWWSSL